MRRSATRRATRQHRSIQIHLYVPRSFQGLFWSESRGNAVPQGPTQPLSKKLVSLKWLTRPRKCMSGGFLERRRSRSSGSLQSSGEETKSDAGRRSHLVSSVETLVALGRFCREAGRRSSWRKKLVAVQQQLQQAPVICNSSADDYCATMLVPCAGTMQPKRSTQQGVTARPRAKDRQGGSLGGDPNKSKDKG